MIREDLQKLVILSIQEQFPGAIAVWCGSGIEDDEFEGIDFFEAYLIPAEDKARLQDLAWELEKESAEPNGFSIMVHGFTPEETSKFRADELQKAKIVDAFAGIGASILQIGSNWLNFSQAKAQLYTESNWGPKRGRRSQEWYTSSVPWQSAVSIVTRTFRIDPIGTGYSHVRARHGGYTE